MEGKLLLAEDKPIGSLETVDASAASTDVGHVHCKSNVQAPVKIEYIFNQLVSGVCGVIDLAGPMALLK